MSIVLMTALPPGTGLIDGNPYLEALPERTKVLLELSRETSHDLTGEARMASVIAAVCFERCFDERIEDADVSERLSLAIKAIRSSASLKRDIFEIQLKTDGDMGMKRVGAEITVVEADPALVEKRRKMVWNARD